MRKLLFVIIPVAVLCFVYVGFVLYPLTATIGESIRHENNFTLKYYWGMFTNPSTLEAVWNSVYVSLLSVLFSTVVGGFLAVVFTQMEFPFRKFLSRLIILPLALPPLVGVVAFLFVFGESGILSRTASKFLGFPSGLISFDGITAIIAVHTYSFYVYFYLFVSTYLRNLDASQLEAAQTFGSSTWRTVRAIVLPELTPALLGASILTFMTSMASFSAPLLFGGDKRFMTLQIYNAKLNGEMNVASALAIALTAVSVLFFILFRMVGAQSAATQKAKGVRRTGVIRFSATAKRLMIAVAFVFLAIELLPIIMIVVISFAREGSWTWQILPGSYTGENYFKLFSDPHVFDPIFNSLLMSILTVVASIIMGVSLAYFIAKGRLGRFRFWVDILSALPYAIPGTVVALSLILAFNKPTVFSAGAILVGTFWILPIAYFVRMFPMVIRSTTASLERLDDSLIEAGQALGANGFARFRFIIFPLILPGIVAGGLLVMITALGEFVSSVLLYAYSNRPISVEILAQMRSYNFGSAAAYSVALLVLILGIVSLSNWLSRASASGETGFNI